MKVENKNTVNFDDTVDFKDDSFEIDYNKKIINDKLTDRFKNDVNNQVNLNNLISRYIITTGSNVGVIDTHSKDLIKFISEADFKFITRNLKEEKFSKNGMKTEYAYKEFFESDRVKTISKIVFNPNGTGRDEYNLFNGFNFENNDKTINDDDVSLVINLIHELTGYNNEGTQYVLNWISHIIQKPGERALTNIYFKGFQGVGKSIITENLLGSILGKYHHTVMDLSPFEGNFNDELVGKLLINFEEAIFNGDKKTANKIKSFTTGKKLNVKKKFADTFSINNYARIIGSSNNDNVAAVEKGERRNIIFNSSQDKKGDFEYFISIVNFIEENTELLFNYFANRDISKYDPKVLPKTEASEEARIENLDSFEEFLLELNSDLYELEVGNDCSFSKNENIYVMKTYLYDRFVKFNKNTCPSKYKIDTNYKFTKKINDVFGDISSKQRFKLDEKSHNCFVFNKQEMSEKIKNYIGLTKI